MKRLFHAARACRLQVATLDKRRLGKSLPRGRNFLALVVSRGGGRGKRDSETVSFTRVTKSPPLG